MGAAISGTGGGGGYGGTVLVTLLNSGASQITTTGSHADAILAQSIGGGGGNASSASSKAAGAGNEGTGIALSMGGAGGAGGAGGGVTVLNGSTAGAGQTLYTTGAMSSAIVAQSIGGGGGRGGASSSSTDGSGVADVSATLGGSGGSGGVGGTVAVTSGGLVKTAGDHSIGILAQSVGGGGGNASASSTAAKDSHADANLSATLGGSGGSGGDGGDVTVTLLSTLVTEGTNAMGIVAQSIGGGGGNAATSQEKATGGKVSVALGLGGSGGTGGDGGAVLVNVAASMGTSGAHATAILAQSIGGGGGTGGASNNAATSRIALGAGLGGAGGAAGDGGAASVALNQQAKLVLSTSGAHADAVLVQSIGGGGGKAGGGSGKADGASGGDVSLTLALGASGGDGGAGGIVTISDQANGGSIVTSGHESAGLVAQSIGGGGGKGGSAASSGAGSSTVSLSGAVGGTGGSGGDGGTVNVTFANAIVTQGAGSDGILAQSIGGGGGSAAFTNAIDKADKADIALSLGLGGSGGAGGSGGEVNITQSGSILTQGEAAIGLVAQSIGGGGGRASAVAAKSNGGTVNGAVSLGATGGTGNVGGEVNVTVSGAIATSGTHSDGVLAQSIGGGGGIMQATSTDSASDASIGITIGGNGGSGNTGGTVNATLAQGGTISTTGRSAHGILLQSIGGGGGKVASSRSGAFVGLSFGGDDGGSGGDGGTVNATIGGGIETSGAGSNGLFVQSIGGGGGLAGDMASTVFDISHTSVGTGGGDGDGGAINVTVNGSIVSQGENAAAVNLQSIGGGGGAIQTSGVSGIGSAGGTGVGGAVTLAVNGTISATGSFSRHLCGEPRRHGREQYCHRGEFRCRRFRRQGRARRRYHAFWRCRQQHRHCGQCSGAGAGRRRHPRGGGERDRAECRHGHRIGGPRARDQCVHQPRGWRVQCRRRGAAQWRYALERRYPLAVRLGKIGSSAVTGNLTSPGTLAIDVDLRRGPRRQHRRERGGGPYGRNGGHQCGRHRTQRHGHIYQCGDPDRRAGLYRQFARLPVAAGGGDSQRRATRLWGDGAGQFHAGRCRSQSQPAGHCCPPSVGLECRRGERGKPGLLGTGRHFRHGLGLSGRAERPLSGTARSRRQHPHQRKPGGDEPHHELPGLR